MAITGRRQDKKWWSFYYYYFFLTDKKYNFSSYLLKDNILLSTTIWTPCDASKKLHAFVKHLYAGFPSFFTTLFTFTYFLSSIFLFVSVNTNDEFISRI